MDNNNNGNGVAWTALVLAIIAIIFAWTAFNRAGADLGDIVEREVEQSVQEAQREYREAEIEVRQNTSDALNDAAADVSVDGDPNTAGE